MDPYTVNRNRNYSPMSPFYKNDVQTSNSRSSNGYYGSRSSFRDHPDLYASNESSNPQRREPVYRMYEPPQDMPYSFPSRSPVADNVGYSHFGTESGSAFRRVKYAPPESSNCTIRQDEDGWYYSQSVQRAAPMRQWNESQTGPHRSMHSAAYPSAAYPSAAYPTYAANEAELGHLSNYYDYADYLPYQGMEEIPSSFHDDFYSVSGGPSGPSQQKRFASRNMYSMSDSTYLNADELEAISNLNSSNGVYAPRLAGGEKEYRKSSVSSAAVKSPGAMSGLSIGTLQNPSQGTSHNPPQNPAQSKRPSMPMDPNEARNAAYPPLHLTSLWQYEVYREIWNSMEETEKIRLLNASLKEYMIEDALLRKEIDRAIAEKKACHILQSRKLFVELAIVYSQSVQIWLEFCRLEMECGEYINARAVLSTAIQLHPKNELILQKRLRVEERLYDFNSVISVINELRSLDTPRSIRIMIEGISTLSKIGYEKMASEYAHSLSTIPKYNTGNLCMELMLQEQRCGECSALSRGIETAVSQFPKYGPLWFFCFDLLEHFITINWNNGNMTERVLSSRIDALVEMAGGNLTADIIWKTYFYRFQFLMRSLMYCRCTCYDDPHRILELIKAEGRVIERMEVDMKRCIVECPSTLLWKLYLSLARLFGILGFSDVAQKFMHRSYWKAPEKSRHGVLLEYSKFEFMRHHKERSNALLRHGLCLFPSEWKLILEQIQQLVLQERYAEALSLNYLALQQHIGAGRLWSCFIHIVHLVFGPEQAFAAFRKALKKVAKSGEVWCEGARIYLNPTFSQFHPLNAAKCLNYAVFFTPQYGDSFIETLRLLIIVSPVFLHCHDFTNGILLLHMLESQPFLIMFIKRASHFSPNYGPLWFRCQEYLLSPPKEVLYRSLHIVAKSVAENASLYYEALLCSMRRKQNTTEGMVSPSPYRKEFTYACKPDYMFEIANPSNQMIRLTKILYSGSQMDG